MKKILLILPLLTLLSVAQAEDEVSAQVISYGVSPSGVCETFSTASIPADHKRVENCDVVEYDDRNTSLFERLQARFSSRGNKTGEEAENTEKTIFGKYKRIGRASLGQGADATRRNANDREKTVGTDRRSTAKNFNSIYRTHNLKGGFDRDPEEEAEPTTRRPALFSRVSTKNTDKKISSDAKWTASADQRFREKNYGPNPYNIRSQRSAEQRKVRENKKNTSRVDVNGRITSNQYRWRPGRLEGSLNGDLDFRETQAEKQAEIQAELLGE